MSGSKKNQKRFFDSRTDTHTHAHTDRSRILFSAGLLLIVALITASFFAWSWMQKSISFPIKQIRLEGQFIYETPKQLQRIILSGMSGGFFDLNVSLAKEQLLALPWIAHVSFRRIWPGTLSVHILEQEPIARFGKNGVLNAEGKVFYPDIKTIPTNLPDLEGAVDQSATLFAFYQTLNVQAKKIGLSVIVLHENREQSWDLQLSNQLKVILGRVDPLMRFERFVAIYSKIIASSTDSLTLIDLRYPNGVAVQFQQNNAKNTVKTPTKPDIKK